jgi:hypothetical protein
MGELIFYSFDRTADYTTVWNSLDYPALSFPVTVVDPTLDPPKPAHTFMSEEDKVVYDLCKEFSDWCISTSTLTTCSRCSRDIQGCACWAAVGWQNPRRGGFDKDGRDSRRGLQATSEIVIPK